MKSYFNLDFIRELSKICDTEANCYAYPQEISDVYYLKLFKLPPVLLKYCQQLPLSIDGQIEQFHKVIARLASKRITITDGTYPYDYSSTYPRNLLESGETVSSILVSSKHGLNIFSYLSTHTHIKDGHIRNDSIDHKSDRLSTKLALRPH